MKTAEEILAHSGVKGMHWGVRRNLSSGSSSTVLVPKPPARSSGKFVANPSGKKAAILADSSTMKTKLSRNKDKNTPSPEGATYKQLLTKAKKEGIHTLSNDELRTIALRNEAEVKFKKAFPKKKNPAAKLLVATLLSDFGNSQLSSLAGRVHPKGPATVKGLGEIAKLLKPVKSEKEKK